jgi:hypothetical protein
LRSGSPPAARIARRAIASIASSATPISTASCGWSAATIAPNVACTAASAVGHVSGLCGQESHVARWRSHSAGQR